MVKVKFPEGYPVTLKTFVFQEEARVEKVLENVRKVVKLPVEDAGLFVSAQNLWLDPNQPLYFYKGLQYLKYIEYRLRSEPTKIYSSLDVYMPPEKTETKPTSTPPQATRKPVATPASAVKSNVLKTSTTTSEMDEMAEEALHDDEFEDNYQEHNNYSTGMYQDEEEDYQPEDSTPVQQSQDGENLEAMTNEQLVEMVKGYKSIVARKGQEVRTLQQENAALKESNAAFEEDLNQLQQENDSLHAELDQRKQVIAQQEIHINKMQGGIKRMTRKVPNKQYKSAQELVSELDDLLNFDDL